MGPLAMDPAVDVDKNLISLLIRIKHDSYYRTLTIGIILAVINNQWF